MGLPYKQYEEKIAYGVLGIKIGYKGCVEFISENIQNGDFGLGIFEKSKILKPFSEYAI